MTSKALRNHSSSVHTFVTNDIANKIINGKMSTLSILKGLFTCETSSRAAPRRCGAIYEHLRNP